jgi:rhodanese-related sulfurtransferase
MHNSPHKTTAFVEIDNSDPMMMAAGCSNKIVARTKFERYRRIKPQTLAKMMKDFDYDDDRMFDESDGGILIQPHHNMFAEEAKDTKDAYEVESTYSNKTTQSVASIFESNAEFYDSIERQKKGNTKKFDTMSYAPTEDIMNSTSGILLLDLRDAEEYSMSHIKGAINWPSPNIARDKYVKPIWNYRNKEGKIILIYHENEKNVIEAAAMLVDKEFSNIYILTNGFDTFAEEHSEYIEGKGAYSATGDDLSGTQKSSLSYTGHYKKNVKALASCPRF